MQQLKEKKVENIKGINKTNQIVLFEAQMQINGQALSIRSLRHHYKLPFDEVRKNLEKRVFHGCVLSCFSWMCLRPDRKFKNFCTKQVPC